jgi:hypothetical protein
MTNLVLFNRTYSQCQDEYFLTGSFLQRGGFRGARWMTESTSSHGHASMRLRFALTVMAYDAFREDWAFSDLIACMSVNPSHVWVFTFRRSSERLKSKCLPSITARLTAS